MPISNTGLSSLAQRMRAGRAGDGPEPLFKPTALVRSATQGEGSSQNVAANPDSRAVVNLQEVLL